MTTLPRALLIPAALGAAFVGLPLVAMALAVDWRQMGGLLGSPSSLAALGLSLRTAFASTLVCLVLGVPLAMTLARAHFPGLRVVRGLVLLPLVLPPVVGGIALLYAFGRKGLLGQYLEAGGIHIAFTTVAVVLAQSFVAMPFLVLSLEGALRTAGERYEQVAATLGASPGFVWWRVTLPLVLPGIVSGAVLAFARALGEFGATLTFAGSLEGVTRTLPLEIYLQREVDPDAAVALSVLLVAVAAVIVVTVYSRPVTVSRRRRVRGAAAVESIPMPWRRRGIAASVESSESVRTSRHRRGPGLAPTESDVPPAPSGAPVRRRRGRGSGPVESSEAAATPRDLRGPGRALAESGAPPARSASTLRNRRDSVLAPPLSDAAAPALRVRGRVPQRGVDIDLDVAPGEVVALLGPNGAGKSTVLGMISGLVEAVDAEIVVGERVLTDTVSGVRVPVHARGAATLSQDALLFPHLSAAANVAFGPRAHGVPRADARRRATGWLSAVGAEGLDERRPSEVSGGQAQRIALARALASDPALLLLDEPLAALDVGAAVHLRALLREVCRSGGRTTVLVTHDLLDVFALADRVVVMEDGRIVEQGPAREVLASPRSAFAAQLAGVNLVAGVAAAGETLRAEGGRELAGHGAVDAGAPAVAAFAPSAVALYLQAPHGSPRNVWPGTVIDVQARGEGGVRLRVEVDGLGVVAADLTAGAVADLDLAPGAAVFVVVKAQEITLHPA